jgi:quercetin dioxygenase-like cupin family protein
MPRPQATATLQVDNERVRVYRYDFAPGAETGHHRHGLDYVIVPVTDGELLIESAAGEARASLKAGVSYSRLAGVEHNVVNAGSQPLSFIEVELK